MTKKNDVLEHLKSIKKANSGEIANSLGINPKNIGRYLSELEKEGLITKKHTFKGNIRYNTWIITNNSADRNKNIRKKNKSLTKSINVKNKITQEEKEFLKEIIRRMNRRRYISDDATKKALDILYK